MVWMQLAAVTALMLVHLFGGRARLMHRSTRRGWISLFGGMSIAYVFVHVFPELQSAQQALRDAGPLAFIEHHAYLVALLGLICWYGLEQMARRAQPRPPPDASGRGEESRAPAPVFWLHVASFAAYNALIGYLIAQRYAGGRALWVFALAMALHFLINDNALRREHKDTYHRVGRWLLSVAVLGGWLAGRWSEVSNAATGVLFAFLAGGVVLNVLKEELPEEREGRFSLFALGALLYAALLLVE